MGCGGGGGSQWGYQGIVGPISFGWALHLGGTDFGGVFWSGLEASGCCHYKWTIQGSVSLTSIHTYTPSYTLFSSPEKLCGLLFSLCFGFTINPQYLQPQSLIRENTECSVFSSVFLFFHTSTSVCSLTLLNLFVSSFEGTPSSKEH